MTSTLDMKSPVAQRVVRIISGLMMEEELLEATQRLRGLGVPEELIMPAMVPNAPEGADQAIIAWASKEWNLREVCAWFVLNGAVSKEEAEFFPSELPTDMQRFVDAFVEELAILTPIITKHFKDKGADMSAAAVQDLIFRSSSALAAQFAQYPIVEK